MGKVAADSLRNARVMLDTVGRNINNTQQPGAKALDSSINISPVGKNGAYRTSVVTTRRDDPFKEKVFFSAISSASETEVKAVSLSFLQQSINSASDVQKSRLVDAVTQFVAKSKSVTAVKDVSIKKAFIDQGNALADTLRNATDQVNNLRIDADDNLKQGIKSLNLSLDQLYLLNQKIMKSSAPLYLYDQRDQLIADISEKLAVQVYYGLNGIANLNIKGSGQELLSATGRAEFSYPGANPSDLLNNGKIPEITITKIAKDGSRDRVISAPTVIVGGSDNLSRNGMKGGQIEGWISLRDVELPKSGDAIRSLAQGVAKAVNGVHNNGSTYPPKTFFKGYQSILASQELDLKGKVTFFAIDAEGNQLKGGAGVLNPATIDFAELKGSGVGGKATTLDVVNEISQKLNSNYAAQRAALGNIGGEQGQYLINNMQLAGMSDIGDDGRWTFDLDLQGNAYFGSKIEVLSVFREPAGDNQEAEDLPPAFNLGRSVDARTNGPISLGGFRPGGDNNVQVKVRVTGDNGVVQEGTVTFVVNRDNAKLNGRVAYKTPDPMNPYDNDVGFTTTGIQSHSGVAKAMLVDKNGSEITDPSSSEEGYLVIKTNSSDYRIAIQNGDLKNNSLQSGNFSTLLGLNDFFDFDEVTGKIAVNQVINADPQQLATGMVTLNNENTVKVKVGDKAASADLTFANDFTNNDTITIAGQVFTFVNVAPVNQNQVSIVGGNLAGSLQNLVNKISANPAYIFTAEMNGNDIKLTAKTKGASGNSLQVIAVLNGMNTMNGAAGPVSFSGGEDKDEDVKIASYSIGSGSVEVLKNMQNLSTTMLDFTGLGSASGEFNSTIEEFATTVSAALTSQYNEAKALNGVEQGALELLSDELNRLFAPDFYEEFSKLSENKQYMTAIATYGKTVQSILDRVFDLLFAR